MGALQVSEAAPGASRARPLLSVAIATYNHAHLVGDAIERVLGQGFRGFELLVVDDGSSDDTSTVVQGFTDPRVRYVHRDNGGISAARNTGIAHAAGEYLIFLDDDDIPSSEWLESFAEAVAERPAAVVFGARFITASGALLDPEEYPQPTGPSFLAGSFAVRRDAAQAVGGFAEGLQSAHQTEFSWRLRRWCERNGEEIVESSHPVISIVRRTARERPESSPAKLLQGAEYFFEHHAQAIDAKPKIKADFHAVAGVSAARLGQWSRARSHLVGAIKAEPARLRSWARLGLALMPPVGRRVWGEWDDGVSEPSLIDQTGPPGVLGSNGIRVLVVIDRLTDQAGAEGSTAILIRELQGNGFCFGVVTIGGGVQLHDIGQLLARGLWLREVSEGLAATLGAVHRAIDDFDPDVVHAVLFRAELVARLATLRRPVLASIVNTQYSDEARAVAPSPVKLELVRHVDGFLARHATSHFHAVSEAAADAAVDSLGISRDEITVIRRGRDERRLGRRNDERRRQVRRELGLSDDVPVVLTAARHEPQKRLDLLVEAFAKVVERQPKATLLIAGREGSSTGALRLLIDRLGLGSSVLVLGQRDDVPDLLCAADVFVFSSLYEGLPGAIIEALALELPVVAFDVPTVREAVGDAGILVPPGAVGALSAALLELLGDAERRQELAMAGRKRFGELFALDRYVDEFAALYREVAALGR